MDPIERFEIHVADAALADLRRRLAATRWPDQIEDAGWDYGTELSYLRELCGYWQEKYDWRAAEAELNRYEHARTRIDGQSIHFLHARSRHENALPLLISHGWPGSIVEFLDVIEPLRDRSARRARRDAFHVVCRRCRATASPSRRARAAGIPCAWPTPSPS